jgi:hypothetical protein
MKRKILVTVKFFASAAILTLGIVSIIASGGGSDPQPVIVADIFSDQPTDGDIVFDPVLESFTITNGPETLFFGIDNLDPNLPEYRAFLDFPLDGSTAEEVIPINARIVSATMKVFINEVSFAPIAPTLLDLVSYPITGLRVEDFDSSPLLSQSLEFFASDLGTIVLIDVTPLMREAQRLGLPHFQVRLVLDFVTDVGFVGIEDLPFAPSSTAPRLIVSYRPGSTFLGR